MSPTNLSFRSSMSRQPGDTAVQLNRSQRSSNPPPESSLSRSRVGPQRIADAVQLSPERKAEMLQHMEDSEQHVVNSMLGDEASLTLWKLRMRKKGIAYYVDENVGKGLTRFCCVGVTDAPVVEIMKMFMVSNTEMLLKNVRIMYRNVQEAKILSVLKPATVVNPMQSVYIRYASFDTPILMSGRDICVCVSTNMITLSDGSTVGYCLWDSVDIPGCPDRSATDKIIRSKMWHSGFFFLNSGMRNAVTKVCYLINVEIGGVVPQLLGRIHMTIFGGNCRRVCKHYRKRTLDPETFTHLDDWTPKSGAKACNVCGRSFNALAKKYNCVRCGEVVCGRGCFFKEEVSVPGAMVTRVRICQSCLEYTGMLTTNLQAIAARGNLNSNGSGVRDLLRHNSDSSRIFP
uniref:FYVE-type domain-containing protein n=2 Tax=Phytophthora ramorum TaxID=164328 RepID=H3GPT0_PHYRM